MFKNYLTVALRNLRGNKAYALINISGLTMGMACSILILLYVRDEMSYDRFHQDSDRIYRVVQEQRFGGNVQQVAVVAAPIAPALVSDYPEVESSVRLRSRHEMLNYGPRRFPDEHVVFADVDFFQLFSFQLLQGDPVTALREPNSIVLTQNLAVKYFGGEEPLGKVIQMNRRNDFIVTGVVRNPPPNSHFQFDALASFSTFSTQQGNRWLTSWGTNLLSTYIRLKKETSAKNFDAKLVDFIVRHRGADDSVHISYYLQPLTDIHFQTHFVADSSEVTDKNYIYIFSVIALFVLLIACINYVNLATGRSVKRMREVGVRKVLGAFRFQLARQFLSESVLLAFLALGCAVLVLEVVLPTFNELNGTQLCLDYRQNFVVFVGLFLMMMLVGVLAGAYPAFYLSGFHPALALKGNLKSGAIASVRLRKLLVIAQFAIAVVLIAGTIVVFRQVNYVKTKHLGYDKEHLVGITIRDKALWGKPEEIKSAFLQNTQVIKATATSDFMTDFFSQSGIRRESDPEGKDWLISRLFVDADFIRTMDMRLIAGRDFSNLLASDSTQAFIMNQTATRRFGWTQPGEALNQQVISNGRRGPVIGVVENFHFASLREEIEPLVLLDDPKETSALTLRMRTQDVSRTLRELEKTWVRLSPGWPFEYAFLDSQLDALYKEDLRVGQIVGLFSAIAIAISCLGLLGLSVFSIEQRTKEISVRKVLGATVTNVTTLLSKDFVKLVLFANVIAWPVAWVAMNRWLQNFAYRIEISWWVFALAGGLALLVALLTVSTQAVRAALASPLESLRYE